MLKIKNLLSYLNRERKKNFSTGQVSRKKFNDLSQKYNILVDAIASTEKKFEKKALLTTAIPVTENFDGQELCLFISHSVTPYIKPHVAHHVQALIKSGIHVILILNTDQPKFECQLDDWTHALAGLFIRENIGFDFGAWSHIYSIIYKDSDPSHLYLINDSMIGPLSESMFKGMLEKIRNSSVDMLGLTANHEPIFHLQSFFLIFSNKILHDQRFQSFFKSLWQLPTKDMVIDFYETRTTQLIQRLGYSTQALYTTGNTFTEKSDAVIHNLDALFALNFPYIKTSMANKPVGKKILDKYLPQINHIG
ncbi:MAG: rhamnan synthesis F family protein [Rhodoferax sp.]|uniref:rhamnan synthesis F family protein n=1 Tax=Rhodoferax sp. TaxID=50421 RepID=UPI0032650CB9